MTGLGVYEKDCREGCYKDHGKGLGFSIDGQYIEMGLRRSMPRTLLPATLTTTINSESIYIARLDKTAVCKAAMAAATCLNSTAYRYAMLSEHKQCLPGKMKCLRC